LQPGNTRPMGLQIRLDFFLGHYKHSDF